MIHYLMASLTFWLTDILARGRHTNSQVIASGVPSRHEKKGRLIAGYYMASSMGRQDEPNHVLWLVPWAGKMELFCPIGTTCCVPQEKFPQKPYNKSFVDQACSRLWTSTSSQSINMQKKNLANIQPSWPLTWSITHTYGVAQGIGVSFKILTNQQTDTTTWNITLSLVTSPTLTLLE